MYGMIANGNAVRMIKAPPSSRPGPVSVEFLKDHLELLGPRQPHAVLGL
jgi:hypothetical protein